MSKEIALRKIELAKKLQSPILNLSDLELDEMPGEIAELTWLTHLSLENNQIKDISCLEP
jgi:Leucine-rich repeat (LRR) protein